MTKDLVRRFPASQGYRSQRDIPTTTDLTAYALGAYRAGYLTAPRLREIMFDLSNYANRRYWNGLSPRRRAFLLADVLDHNAALARIEATTRRDYAS